MVGKIKKLLDLIKDANTNLPIKGARVEFYNASTGVIDFVNTLVYHGVPDETLPIAFLKCD